MRGERENYLITRAYITFSTLKARGKEGEKKKNFISSFLAPQQPEGSNFKGLLNGYGRKGKRKKKKKMLENEYLNDVLV